MVQRCSTCRDTRFPAVKICPSCHSDQSTWIECSGEGTLESFCVFHKAYWPGLEERLPYTVLQVSLPEGPTLISNLAGLTDREPRIGATVEAVFEKIAEDLVVVRFAEKTEQ
ncbi:OB-fold domain-containing protein [Rhizobium sp. CNPSo 3968]|nr:OB-fold domain-containing protein [Rhizobium sp. CNPSo 3968]MDK4717836.1 OB-fold domain-containing protein [Rhizobium sp. CNPSo 3968]